MSDCPRLHAIACAGRAAERARITVRRELSRGTTCLRAIAFLAPLLGIFESTALMMLALRSSYSHGCDYGDCAGGISEAYVPVLLSLPIALLACAGFHWLRHQIETFDFEMRTTTLDLLNHLARRRSTRRV